MESSSGVDASQLEGEIEIGSTSAQAHMQVDGDGLKIARKMYSKNKIDPRGNFNNQVPRI